MVTIAPKLMAGMVFRRILGKSIDFFAEVVKLNY